MRSNIAFVVVGLMATLFVASAASATGTRLASASQIRVADLRTADFRVVVTATKRRSGTTPTATVAIVTLHRTDSAAPWIRTGRHVLRGSYFWHVVSGSQAICRLELRTVAATPSERPRVTIQLLVTPSVGCARAYDYPLTPG